MQGDDGDWRAELEKKAFSPRGDGRTESASLIHLYASNVRSIQLQTKPGSIGDSLGAASKGAKAQSSPIRMESARMESTFTPRRMSAHQFNRNTVLLFSHPVSFHADPFSMELMCECSGRETLW